MSSLRLKDPVETNEQTLSDATQRVSLAMSSPCLQSSMQCWQQSKPSVLKVRLDYLARLLVI